MTDDKPIMRPQPEEFVRVTRHQREDGRSCVRILRCLALRMPDGRTFGGRRILAMLRTDGTWWDVPVALQEMAFEIPSDVTHDAPTFAEMDADNAARDLVAAQERHARAQERIAR